MTDQQFKLPHDHDHGHGSDHLKGHIPDTNTITVVSDAMKQLGDPSRLRIFWLLCHCEECVTNIAALTDMTAPAVSHHLRLLKGSDLIVSRRDGKEMYYKAAETDLAQKLHHTIEEVAMISCPK